MCAKDYKPGPEGEAESRERRIGAICQEVISCRRCPRLVEYRERVGMEKVRRFKDWEYWALPVPGFGDPNARLLIIGLAPAAHGGNRTGRIFTGDSSGDWLFRALHKAGFANQPTSVHRNDGLILRDCYIAAMVRCAPPDNKPTPGEIANCVTYLQRELEALNRVRVVVALGRLAFNAYLREQEKRGAPKSRPVFSHGGLWNFGPEWPVLISSYHPSRQNTQTGLLTEPMWDGVFNQAAALLKEA